MMETYRNPETIIFKCAYCIYKDNDKNSCLEHEKYCSNNPDAFSCGTCENHEYKKSLYGGDGYSSGCFYCKFKLDVDNSFHCPLHRKINSICYTFSEPFIINIKSPLHCVFRNYIRGGEHQCSLLDSEIISESCIDDQIFPEQCLLRKKDIMLKIQQSEVEVKDNDK